jgi:hypothetical protein
MGPEGHVDQSDEDGYLDQRADDPGEGLAGGGAEVPMATAMAMAS